MTNTISSSVHSASAYSTAHAAAPSAKLPAGTAAATEKQLETTAAKQSNTGEKAERRQGDENQRQIEKLKQRDREVRAHEAAHKAVGGELAGSIQLQYQQAPDGQRYAVGGEVSIDTAKVSGDPQATLNKANRIQAAALAPANPSSQDRAVAAQASAMAAEAQAELARGPNPDTNTSKAETTPGKSASNQESNAANTGTNNDNQHVGVRQYQQTASAAAEQASIHLIA